MFERLGHTLVRRRRAVLALFTIILIAGGVSSSFLIPRLDNGGYNDPHSDSVKAASYLSSTFHVKDPHGGGAGGVQDTQGPARVSHPDRRLDRTQRRAL